MKTLNREHGMVARKMRLGWAGLAIAGLCGGILSSGNNQLRAEETVIRVEAQKPLGPVNPWLFGQNIEAADGRGIFSEAWNATTFDKSGIRDGQGYWNATAGKPYPEVVSMTRQIGCGMLRYPGGCLAHNYDWRKAVGSLSERGDWKFGIDEFLTLCKELGAEPLITVSDYVLPAEQMPEHAAGLVEYLNAPATPEHPWAMKRKEAGHSEPYGVKWFELGNESDHGSHAGEVHRAFSPQQYVTYANDCAKAMKAVDPTIKVGVVTVPGPGDNMDCPWNMAVYKGAAKSADFLVVHFYGPRVSGADAADAFKSSMAYPDQLERYMNAYRRLCKEGSGKDLPLAVTEYNIGFSGDKPVQWRFTFTAGLLCADMMRLFMQPETKVMNADYWQIANGWWGMFRTRDGAITKKQAPLALYQLWGEHFGKTLLPVTVRNAPRAEAPAAGGLAKSSGDKLVERSKVSEVDVNGLRFQGAKNEGMEVVSQESGAFSLRLNHHKKETYIELMRFANTAGDTCQVRIAFESRFTPEQGQPHTGTLGLSLIDSRGWAATQSGIAVDSIDRSTEWEPFSGVFNAGKDCPGAALLLRVPTPKSDLSGLLEVRNLKIEIWNGGTAPAYRALTASSSLSADGKTLHLLVFNKDFEKSLTAGIELNGFLPISAASWTATQENVAGTGYVEPKQDTVSLPVQSGALQLTFPAHSMTAIDFRR